MNLLAAVLKVCSLADPVVVETVIAEAQAQHIDPEALLAIGVIESGLRLRNVLGVQACYSSKPVLSMKACVHIGAVSLHNKWPNTVTHAGMHRAFRRYNNTAHRHKYATKALHIVKTLRRLSKG